MSLRVMPIIDAGWVTRDGKWLATQDGQTVKCRRKDTNSRERIKERWEKKLLTQQKRPVYRVPFPRYHTYSGMSDELEYLARDYADIAEVFTIGRSVEGRQILGIKIAADIRSERPLLRPQIKFSANIHGDEAVCREMLIGLARALCEQYEFDKEITVLLNKCEVHLLPSLNPDGACRKTRTNANNKDLNRCFPDWSSLGDRDIILEDREPEVAAVIRHLASNNFVLSVDFHDGWTMVTFPWDDSPACTDTENAVCEEDDTFYDLALSYAYNHSFMYKGNCPCHPEPITIGNYRSDDLEIVSGGLQDFTYLFTDCLELTVEVSCQKRPPARSLSRQWRAHYRSMVSLLASVDGGVRGLVLDSRGEAVSGARIRVEGMEKETSASPRGEYWRLLRPGVYRITASSGALFGCVDVHLTSQLGDGTVRADIILNDIDRNYEHCQDSSQAN